MIYETTYQEYEQFQQMVNDRVVDEFFRECHDADEHAEVQTIEDEYRTTELRYLYNALVEAHNRASENGNLLEAVMYRRLLTRVRGYNERIEAEHEEMVKQMDSMHAGPGPDASMEDFFGL